MLQVSNQSYCPSDVLIKILYAKLARELPVPVQIQMLGYTKDQIRYAFASALVAIKERKVYYLPCQVQCWDSNVEFWLIDRDCNLREEFFKEILNRLDLHNSANPDSHDFKLRLGEEVSTWFLRNPAEAEKYGLIKDKKCRLTLVRIPEQIGDL